MSTGEGGGNDAIEGEAPADAFALVANDQRFEMLTALWTAQQEGETPLAFSDFHDRVGYGILDSSTITWTSLRRESFVGPKTGTH